MKPAITSMIAGAIALAGAATAQAQSITDTEGIPRLPSVFRNCEEPLPWYCARPTGLLWFGSIATLQNARAASFRAAQGVCADGERGEGPHCRRCCTGAGR